jgi:hypothetical protein
MTSFQNFSRYDVIPQVSVADMSAPVWVPVIARIGAVCRTRSFHLESVLHISAVVSTLYP